MCNIFELINRWFSGNQTPSPTPQIEHDVVVNPPRTEILSENNEWLNLKPIDLSKIRPHQLDDSEYIQEVYEKKQVTLHHTVSGNGVSGDIGTWENDPRRIATCIIVDRKGVPWQLFNSKYWAAHLGTGDLTLDKNSIGIEIDSWGWLKEGNGEKMRFGNRNVTTKKGRMYNSYGYVVDVPLQHYPGGFRGYQYYEKYTVEQIQTVGELLLLWNQRYGIPLEYNSDMWDISSRALNGEPGVWSHVSYRPWNQKTDCHPQPELVKMLKSISRIIT